MGTALDPVTGEERALRATQLAVEDQSVDAADVRLAYVSAGAERVSAGAYSPTLTPGEEFSLCVASFFELMFAQ